MEASSKFREGHRKFKERFAAAREEFERLARDGQKPTALWIGCSDSRVIPEMITEAGPGELFVMRNVANIVPACGAPGSDQAGAVIEYAVLGLKVTHVAICGHTACGGIRALAKGVDAGSSPHLARWLELARPAALPGGEGLDPAWELASVKANTLLQRANLMTYPCVAERAAAGLLAVRAGVYDTFTGDLLVAGDTPDEWRVVAEI